MSSIHSYPPELVGDDAYLDEFSRQLETKRFPNPDASLILEVTKARFVAEAARAVDEVAFADGIDVHREPIFDPFIRFEVVAALVDDPRREQFDDPEFDELLSKMQLPETVSPEDDPEAFLTEALSERELTFFDYPAPPLHVIEAAASEGQELIDGTSAERIESVPEQHRTYVRQRTMIEAIVAGARDLAVSTYDDVIDRIHAESPSKWRYEDETEYAEVVAFNAALAAESMLEDEGELITPP